MALLIFRSTEPINVVRDRILSEVGEAPLLSFGWPFASKHKLFCGEVWEDGFRLYRMIDHRNAWLPVACGRLESLEYGTRIVIRLRPNPAGLTMNILWSIGWGVPRVISLVRLVLKIPVEGPPHAGSAIGLLLAMIVVPWIVMIPAELVEDLEYDRAFRQVLQITDKSQGLRR